MKSSDSVAFDDVDECIYCYFVIKRKTKISQKKTAFLIQFKFFQIRFLRY